MHILKEKRIRKTEDNDIVIDMQSLNRKMQLVTNIRKRQEQYIIALILTKNKKVQEILFEKIKLSDIQDQNVRAVYEYILNLNKDNDINKIDILSKMQDENLIRELTEIMYIDLSNTDILKLLNDVLKNKNKEKLYFRRDEIVKRLSENISDDESEVLKLELNQIILELSKIR